MVCKKCGTEMTTQLVAEKKKRSILSIIMWLLLCVCTCGIVLLIFPALRGSKTTTETYFVCPKCGYRFKK